MIDAHLGPFSASSQTLRTRPDRCPGVLRPWPADDGLLVRIRLVGGRVSSAALRSLAAVAEEYGDGRVHVTSRANLQVRGFAGTDGGLDANALAAIEQTGLLPSRSHDLVRNIMVSPGSGLDGGRADLRPVAAELDKLICVDPGLASLPGKFLVVLDDGRGDLVGHRCDVGAVALDAKTAQLRVGGGWGSVVPLEATAALLAELAWDFVIRRGTGPTAAWHIEELAVPVFATVPPDPRVPEPSPPMGYGEVAGGRHVEVSEAGLDRTAIWDLTAEVEHVVVTPWRGVLVPSREAGR